MKTTQRFLALTAVLGLVTGLGANASAVELLTAGSFEYEGPNAGEVPFWTLEEHRTGDPENLVNSAALAGFANSDFDTEAGTGLWIRAFVGNPTDGTAEAILTQTVPATPGETYVFSGEAEFEQNYSGGVSTLDPLSDWGAIPSPTQSLFELAFLDSSGEVIGTPMVRDVASETFNGLGYAAISALTDTAPAGAAEVRVRAIASGLAINIDPGQSAFYDNFSLSTTSSPTSELLTNGDLNQGPPTAEDFFEFIETPEGTDTLQLAGFANNPDTGGATGVWIRPFAADGAAGEVRQTVPGTEGTEYTFAASARWEVNYLGDDLSGANETLIELAFLDSEGEEIETAVLDLRDDGKTADDAWSTHSVSATAPTGTVDVRVAAIVNNYLNNSENGNAQSAFWDDLSLMAAVGLDGDYNGDGTVDAADYTVWRDGGSPDSSQAGYDLWAANYGAVAGSSSVAIPEPTTALLAALALTAISSRRRA